jgi:hypothetical protein
MQITKGKIKKPALLLVFGTDGVGKSTFAAEAPGAIFIGPESGSNDLDVARFNNIKTFQDVKKAVRFLIDEKHEYQTLALDSLDWIEPLLWQYVCSLDMKKPEIIDEAFGGYGKGFVKANAIWKELMVDLQELRDKREMNIVAIAHSQIKVFNDPSEILPYDRYILKLNEKASALWREFVDCVLFVNFETIVRKENKNDKKGKAFGDDVRKMYTQRRPSFDAKNRYGLPFELHLGWKEFEAARGSGVQTIIEELTEELVYLSSKLPENKQAAMIAAVENAKNDKTMLTKIRDHAKALTDQ